MEIRPIIFMFFRYHTLSGGYRRNYEVLKRGKAEGVNYIVVTDSRSYRNALKMFPDFIEILQDYRVYMINEKSSQISHRGLKSVAAYRAAFLRATVVSQIARKEDADLIVSPGEAYIDVLTSYLAGSICSKPWTAVFQPASYFLEPSSVGSLNPLNVMKHTSEQTPRSLGFMAKLGLSFELYHLLKMAERSLMLSVSKSAAENVQFLNPEIDFRVISPGNGIDFKELQKRGKATHYEALFFGRLTPEKGVRDLLPIWRQVVEKNPNAKLGIAGITENPKFVEDLRHTISRLGLQKNVVFLGELNREALIRSIRSSILTINPSRLDCFSLVTLESLACGTPVVAYDIPAIKDNFGESSAVLRCPLKNKGSMAKEILYILGNPKVRVNLSDEAEKYAASYDWKNVVRSEKQAYFDVIKWHA